MLASLYFSLFITMKISVYNSQVLVGYHQWPALYVYCYTTQRRYIEHCRYNNLDLSSYLRFYCTKLYFK
jgi:hypothetical protein